MFNVAEWNTINPNRNVQEIIFSSKVSASVTYKETIWDILHVQLYKTEVDTDLLKKGF